MSKIDCPTCYTYNNNYRRGVIKCPHCSSGCSKCNQSGFIECPNCKGTGKKDG